MFNRSGTGNYAYTAARVKAKKSKLLREEDYNKLLMMSVPEISNYISDAGYAKEMADMGNRYAGLDLVEHATYTNMVVAFGSIAEAATGDLREMVLSYLTKWDFWNLKVILRGKKYGLPAEEIRQDLVPAGVLRAEDLDKLLAAATVEDTLVIFTARTGMHVSEEAMATYKTTQMLGAIEDDLVKTYYRTILAAVGDKDRPRRIFRDYIRNRIDTLNTTTALKFKVEGITGDVIMKYFIPGGMEVDEKVMAQLSAAPDYKSALNVLQSLKFYSTIKEALTDTPTVLDVVNAMNNYDMGYANKVAHMYPLSVIPVVDYMIHKEREVGNIRMIAHGVDSGLDRDTMKGLLVI